MRYIIKILIAVLIFTQFAYAQSNPSTRKCDEQDQEIVSLINQYQELRERRRRLDQGVFDADLDSAKGKLQEVLSKLGEELGRPPYTKEKIIRCLGAPDAIKNHQQMDGLLEIYRREKRIAGQEVKERKGRIYLIYFWRGWHDFLFFISEGDHVVDHGWWFAYE
jgi:hypothetical protein